MLRRFDYLLEKQEQEAYNFVQQEPFDNYTQDSEQPFYNNQIYRKKGKSMHIMLEPKQNIHIDMSIRKAKLTFKAEIQNKYSPPKQKDSTEYNNQIYYKTINKYRERIFKFRQRIDEKHAKDNYLNKQTSKVSEGKHRSFAKSHEQLSKKMKDNIKKVKPLNAYFVKQVDSTPQRQISLRDHIRQNLWKKISQINTIANTQPNKVNQKIQEIDPQSQMQRIRIITNNQNTQGKVLTENSSQNISDNIFEVRRLMRRYLNKQ